METKENMLETNTKLQKSYKGSVPKVCLQCGKKFFVFPIQIKRGTGKFCSHSCAFRHRQLGKGNTNWKGGKFINMKGYVEIKKYSHPFRKKSNYIFEHRLVMENFLKKNEPNHPALIEINGIKYLSKNFVVHHKDHNKSNNDINNLMVLDPITHLSMENKGINNPMYGKKWGRPFKKGHIPQHKSYLTHICLNCHKEYSIHPSILKTSKYCSNKCNNLARTKKLKKECLECKKEFWISLSKEKKGWGKYCSIKCRTVNKKRNSNSFGSSRGVSI